MDLNALPSLLRAVQAARPTQRKPDPFASLLEGATRIDSPEASEVASEEETPRIPLDLSPLWAFPEPYVTEDQVVGAYQTAQEPGLPSARLDLVL